MTNVVYKIFHCIELISLTIATNTIKTIAIAIVNITVSIFSGFVLKRTASF